MTIRAKFRVNMIQKANEAGAASIYLAPVYGDTPENKCFFEATPGGQIMLYTVNKAAAEQFSLGQEFYIDFTPAPISGS